MLFIEAGSLTSILNRMEEKGLIERRNAQWKQKDFSYFYDRIREKKSEACRRSFCGDRGGCVERYFSRRSRGFMKIYHKIYSNLSETGCEETEKEGRNK